MVETWSSASCNLCAQQAVVPRLTPKKLESVSNLLSLNEETKGVAVECMILIIN
jgi:hypothetical protein